MENSLVCQDNINKKLIFYYYNGTSLNINIKIKSYLSRNQLEIYDISSLTYFLLKLKILPSKLRPAIFTFIDNKTWNGNFKKIDFDGYYGFGFRTLYKVELNPKIFSFLSNLKELIDKVEYNYCYIGRKHKKIVTKEELFKIFLTKVLTNKPLSESDGSILLDIHMSLERHKDYWKNRFESYWRKGNNISGDDDIYSPLYISNSTLLGVKFTKKELFDLKDNIKYFLEILRNVTLSDGVDFDSYIDSWASRLLRSSCSDDFERSVRRGV